MTQNLSVVLLTGQSGSGKSTAIRALEDHDYVCVDNVPVGLIEPLIDIIRTRDSHDKLALLLDVRSPGGLAEAPALLERLKASSVAVRVIYFEAQEEVLLRRYSETRRRHPLDSGTGLADALAAERRILVPLRELADEHIDTSRLTPHELRDRVVAELAERSVGDDLQIRLLSFGFKYGVPSEADLMLDVRFLPNPYFVPELQLKSGLDDAVYNYVLDKPQAQALIDHTMDFLLFVLPQFQHEGKRYLTIAVGCTGGQHRSVSITRALQERLRAAGFGANTSHRDAKEIAS